MNAVYSVFYELDNVFEICRTDFLSAEEANLWVRHYLMHICNAKFYFILKDGHILINGDFIDESQAFFKDCMKFSIKLDTYQATTGCQPIQR
ncbi:hypothetical protein [Mucilaginibacter sp. PAMB04168]|uniref:hypothetical protein n=1 Tax=Mucilaginibacter sp. PAMB04168 TaxID=3138567 RepID=UPI0031F6766C